MMGSHKLCRDCGALKRRNEFSLRNIEKGYLSPHCKPCAVIRTNAWVDTHRERRNAYVRTYQAQPRVRAQRMAYKRSRYASDPAYRESRRRELQRYRRRTRPCAGGNHGLLCYPYLTDTALDGAELLVRINALVPRWAEPIRADVCQDLALAVLAGAIKVEELGRYVTAYVKRNLPMSSKRVLYIDSLSARARERVEVYAQQLAEAWTG